MRERTREREVEDNGLPPQEAAPNLEKAFADLEYKLDKCVEVCETKEFPDDLLLCAQAQAPSLVFPGEVKAALLPQCDILLPNLKALQAAQQAERTDQAQKEHEAVQEHLAMMGNCPLGFEWLKNSDGSGWHCAGGTHFVSNGDLEHIYTEYRYSDY